MIYWCSQGPLMHILPVKDSRNLSTEAYILRKSTWNQPPGSTSPPGSWTTPRPPWTGLASPSSNTLPTSQQGWRNIQERLCSGSTAQMWAILTIQFPTRGTRNSTPSIRYFVHICCSSKVPSWIFWRHSPNKPKVWNLLADSQVTNISTWIKQS